ncbi:MAG: HupE/UreJ family protein [Sphingobium sp.]
MTYRGMRAVHRILIAGICAATLSAPALAHPGHQESGLVAGLLHPLTGMDHLAAMLMVGLWAGLAAGRALWLLPAAFLSAMLGGFGFGILAQTGGSEAELLIILSVLALGGAVALKLHAPLVLAAGLAGLFGFAHGMAHGLESPGGEAAFTFAGGFLVATAALHFAGLALARYVPAGWVRGIGIAVTGFGLLLAGTA